TEREGGEISLHKQNSLSPKKEKPSPLEGEGWVGGNAAERYSTSAASRPRNSIRRPIPPCQPIPPDHHVAIRIIDIIARRARAVLALDRVARAAIAQRVPVCLPRRKPRGHPRAQHLLAALGDQHQLALDDIHELILAAVPVPLRRPHARRHAHQINAEL